ncbi:MAG: chromate efflux transporter [Silvanigrellaceae bacterium]
MQGLGVFIEVLFVFLKLGIRSFGGPVAHLGYFHETFVRKKGWISESDFASTVALCQALPGPTSSQVGMVLGSTRAGGWGAAAAWIGFTLPSAVIMFFAGFSAISYPLAIPSGMLHGLKLAAIAVVADALHSMSVSLCPDQPRKVLAAAVALLAFAVEFQFANIAMIFAGAVFGIFFLRKSMNVPQELNLIRFKTHLGILFLSVFFLLLFALPAAARMVQNPLLILFDKCFRSGALVFGGGHVVLPLLENEFIAGQLVQRETFLAGYGTAQAVPGPLFSFATFLGAASVPAGAGIGTAGLASAIATVGIFAPSFLLLPGIFPLWKSIRKFAAVHCALAGINATVVGLLASVVMDSVASVAGDHYFSLVLVAVNLVLLKWARWPSWLVVLLSAGLASTGGGTWARF